MNTDDEDFSDTRNYGQYNVECRYPICLFIKHLLKIRQKSGNEHQFLYFLMEKMILIQITTEE